MALYSKELPNIEHCIENLAKYCTIEQKGDFEQATQKVVSGLEQTFERSKCIKKISSHYDESFKAKESFTESESLRKMQS